MTDCCSFYQEKEGNGVEVGIGTVDPFSTYVLGQKVPDGCISIWFGPSLDAENFQSVTSVPGEPRCPVIWERNVGRIHFLGEYKNVIGSAILFSQLKEIGNGIGERGDFMDAGNAIVICYVRLKYAKIVLGTNFQNGTD